MSETVISIKDLSKSFGDHEVLRKIDIDVHSGEVICIVGSSGSGKSTLLRCCTFLETLSSGKISYMDQLAVSAEDGKRPVYAPKTEFRKIQHYFGLVFQNFNLFPHYSVLRNITEAPRLILKKSRAEAEQTAMELLKKVADRHGLVCLIHEKPFEGVNGSGKHDNWSLATDTGENLLKPGSTPSQNAQFLLFLAAFIKGVDEYQEMLRCCVSYPGNDHRLGGNEAPPAIISIFLGDELTAILDAIIQGTEYVDITKKKLTIGVDTLPEIPQDTTDRNRTSPLAFTGNKFEFRMLGSSQSIASPNVVLNTIMAEELSQFADILEKADDFQSALQTLLHDTFTTHQRIIFNGNGYDDAWVQEAKRRGLANLRDTVDCMPAYIDKKNVDLFTRHAILTETEMRARYEIHLENYCKVSAIEASTLLDMVQRHILPAASAYADRLTQTAFHKENSVPALSARMEKTLAQRVTDLGEKLFDTCEALHVALSDAPAADSGIDAARYYRNEVVALTQKAGELIGRLESLVDAKAWPYPTYADILFSV